MKINDIAKLANVSNSAVSIALNGGKGISDQTRRKILDIVREHGYVPRTKVKKKPAPKTRADMQQSIYLLACSNSAVITQEFDSAPFFAEVIYTLEEKVSAMGYTLVFSKVPVSLLSGELSDNVGIKNAAGILLIGTNLSREEMRYIDALNHNIVVLDNSDRHLNLDFVVMSNFHGAYSAISYLNGLGHKTIGYVQSNDRIRNFELRRDGFEEAVRDLGLSAPERFRFGLTPLIDAAKSEFGTLLDRDDLPTAFFCENDYLAIGVMKALQENGVRVPDDVSVIGFDDIGLSTVVSPELTTVHVEKDALAAIAMDKIKARIENGATYTSTTIVDTKLAVRESCKEQ